MLHAIRAKYHEHGIHDQPFLIVKADSGTYGMGVMTVRDAKELEQLNRKTRNKMSVIKDGKSVTEVLIQEGVPSLERVGNAVAEPVVYLMNGEMVGGFYRSHPTRGVDENLNASGASFTPLKMSRDDQMPPHFYANGVIARLATMAAADEMDAPPFACLEAFPSESLDLMCTMPSATCKTFSNHFSSSLS
jgi:glutamate--cysteine ligase